MGKKNKKGDLNMFEDAVDAVGSLVRTGRKSARLIRHATIESSGPVQTLNRIESYVDAANLVVIDEIV